MPQRSPNLPASSREHAHPLVKLLIADLARSGGTSVIEIGSGRGRNTAALSAAGLGVTAVTDDASHAPLAAADAAFDAAISTHGFFHGLPSDAAALCAEVARVLRSAGGLYVTLTSSSDVRCGKGARIDVDTYAAQDGPERGVPHIYYTEQSARALLEPVFRIEEVREVAVDAIVGRWAHADPRGMRHLFIVARRA